MSPFELWAAKRVPNNMTHTNERIAIAASDKGTATPGNEMCRRCRRLVLITTILALVAVTTDNTAQKCIPKYM